MKCPKCRNKGFEPSDDVKKPLKNLGGKERYRSFDTRRYVCMQCGYRFLTKETFFREIEVNTKNGD